MGGTGDRYYNNTVVGERLGWANGWYVRGAGATGHSLTNNLFVSAAPGVNFVFFGHIGTRRRAHPRRQRLRQSDQFRQFRPRVARRRRPILRHRQLAHRCRRRGHSRPTLGDATGAAFGFSGASLAALTGSASYSGTADYTLTASIAEGAGQPLQTGAPCCDIDGRAIPNPATPNIGCWQG